MKKISTWFRGQKRSRLIGGGIFVALFAVFGTAVLLSSFAAGEPSIYITPTTATVQPGNDFTVSLRINPGSAINAVDATINYDQSKVQFKSIDTSASGLTPFISNGGSGKVNIVAGIQGSTISTDVEIGKVTFTALSTASGQTALTASGQAATPEGNAITLVFAGSTITINAPTTSHSASYTVEPTVSSPVVNTQFGLKVYANSDAFYKGGEVIVNLPSGLTYQAPLDTTGTAFNPASTVTDGTGAQSVHLVFVTQSSTLTGKQLVATIPVTASTTGAKSISFTGARLADTANADITPVTTNPVSVTVNSAALPAPVVTIAGKTQIAATENITNLKQAFSITNFDSAATYTVTMSSATVSAQTLTVSGTGTFSIPATLRNNDYTMQVTSTKSGTSGNAGYTIRLRSPNVNRTTCVELSDLLAVNDGYGKASTDLDLNFDGTVGLVDLLSVIQNWGGACI